MTYTVVLRREPEGDYTVLVPALPGCLTCGGTVEEALEMAREVIPAFVEVLRQEGKPTPPGDPDVCLDTSEMGEVLVCRLTIHEEGPPDNPSLVEERLDDVLGEEARAVPADPDT